MLHPQIMSQWEMMENLFKFTYLPHQLLGAMELQNIIAGLSKDNELKKKAIPLRQAHSAAFPWSCVIHTASTQ